MLYETMEDEETTILAEKSTILDGRRRRRENVEIKPPQPPVGVGDGLGLSSAISSLLFFAPRNSALTGFLNISLFFLATIC